MRPSRYSWLLLLLVTFSAAQLSAHVGSKDIFEELHAGPYKVYITIRPPIVIPGVAAVEVRTIGTPVEGIDATPVPMTGEASKHPPTSDTLVRSKDDPNFFTGSLWLMAQGSWEVKLRIHGRMGQNTVAVPVPAAAITNLKMQRGLAILLIALGLFLVAGLAGIVGASVRESRLAPDANPTATQRRGATLSVVLTLGLIGFLLWRADLWWDVEAAAASMKLYRPLAMRPVLRGDSLQLKIGIPDNGEEALAPSNRDFIPDHGKIMHLYAIREPQMDAVFHLHPVLAGSEFDLQLPKMPPGRYELYGDVVHANGFAETLLTKLDVPPDLRGTPLATDDAEGEPAPLSQGLLGNRYRLPDGYTMLWDAPPSPVANTAYTMHFRLLDPKGADPTDMQLYLGMTGHAAFVKTDGTVFAHVHPDGSAAMASMMLANGGSDDSMAGMNMPAMEPVSNAVDFPYGFPSAGRYRVFVQMKHGATVETGVFDTEVR
ncbi:MAG TPA: hypothetical protein VGM27_03450 [Acidobacteriaceae bacterium]